MLSVPLTQLEDTQLVLVQCTLDFLHGYFPVVKSSETGSVVLELLCNNITTSQSGKELSIPNCLCNFSQSLVKVFDTGLSQSIEHARFRIMDGSAQFFMFSFSFTGLSTGLTFSCTLLHVRARSSLVLLDIR